MKLEAILGIGIGVIMFLALIGINIIPLVFIISIFLFAGIMAKQQGIELLSGGEAAGKVCAISFEEIGGQETAIRELREGLDFLLAEHKANELGIRPLKGILLTGPPGTGKTLLAKAASGYTSSSFVAAAGSEFIEMYAGVGAKRVRNLFSQARKKATGEGKRSAIIFIDELEVMASKRGSNSSHLEYDQTLNQLLVEIDGIRVNDKVRVLLIAASNRPDLIDQALLRPGRIDRQVNVELPDRDGRQAILAIHTKNKPLHSEACLDMIAKNTFGFSGADLEAVTNEAAILAWRENASTIAESHLLEAVEKVMIGERTGRHPVDDERERIAVHESGHALVSELLIAGSVSTVTIVPRGHAMGYMRPVQDKDRYLFTSSYIVQQIMISLGGAIAETVWFGDFSTGARNDFEKAWEWARQMVTSGFSSLGIVHERDIPSEKMFDECFLILENSRQETLKMVKSKQEVLGTLTRALLEKETLTRSDLTKIFAV